MAFGLSPMSSGARRLVSRNPNAFKTFEPLAQAIGQDLSDRAAILGGKIVRPGPDGRPMFYELMRRRRGPFCFYAFDLRWLDGSDLRDRPLFERKTLLRKLLPRPARAALYVQQHVASGTDLFGVICEQDMEGVSPSRRAPGTRRRRRPWSRSRTGSTVRRSGARTFSTAGRRTRISCHRRCCSFACTAGHEFSSTAASARRTWRWESAPRDEILSVYHGRQQAVARDLPI